jgi:transposase
MNVRYRVTLSEQERMALQEMLGKGRSQVREVKRAQILLAADQGASEDATAKAVRTSAATIYRTKRCFVEQGLAAALHEAHRPGGRRNQAAARIQWMFTTERAREKLSRVYRPFAIIRQEAAKKQAAG